MCITTVHCAGGESLSHITQLQGFEYYEVENRLPSTETKPVIQEETPIVIFFYKKKKTFLRKGIEGRECHCHSITKSSFTFTQAPLKNIIRHLPCVEGCVTIQITLGYFLSLYIYITALTLSAFFKRKKRVRQICLRLA